MSNTTNFILIMIMIQILIASYTITSAIRETKPNNNPTAIEDTDVEKEPTMFDVLSGKAERVFVNSTDIESCKTTYPYGYQHYENNDKCSFVVWKERQ